MNYRCLWNGLMAQSSSGAGYLEADSREQRWEVCLSVLSFLQDRFRKLQGQLEMTALKLPPEVLPKRDGGCQ